MNEFAFSFMGFSVNSIIVWLFICEPSVLIANRFGHILNGMLGETNLNQILIVVNYNNRLILNNNSTLCSFNFKQ